MEAKGHEFIEAQLSAFLEKIVIAHANKPLLYNSVIKLLIVVLILNITGCTFSSNNAEKHTQGRTFKLTKDSTFIGAWGGELHDEQTGYFPSLTKSFILMYIYTKDNKLFVTRQPKGFDNKNTNEVQALKDYFSHFEYNGIIEAFDTTYIIENEKQIGQYNELTSSIQGQRIIIDNTNNLKFFHLSIDYPNMKDTFLFEELNLEPYYFKTIPNPDKK